MSVEEKESNMKKFTWMIGVVITLVLALPTVGMAKKNKFKEIKPAEEYPVIKYLITDAFSYRVDPKTCLCFATTFTGMVEISCKKFAKIPELLPYVEKCE
jgi:hypothetical protein